jgi:MSHA biogenesis protein MshQ
MTNFFPFMVLKFIQRKRKLLELVTLILCAAFCSNLAWSATYSNSSTTFNWINPATHTKVGYNTLPYKFNTCGTTVPTLDDTISDAIPIGFNFLYGATSYNSLKIETNGRLQFANNNCTSGTNSIGPPQTYTYPYPNASTNNTMKAFGVDLDPTNLVDKPNYPSAASKTSCASIATCYISYASIGTTPNRQFVVTWKSIPEWVTASNTSGSFDFQMILNEDGSFIYQYLNIVHGGTGAAQIGWQLSTTDYTVLTFGASSEPPPNTAILFYIPSSNPIADYRFEEGAWSPSGAGQVTDSSLNIRHGSAEGGTQETSLGKVCRGASIPLNTSAGTVDAIKTGVKFSGAGVNMNGSGTIMFWYKSNASWSGAAAQLIDAGNKFYLTKTASGTLFFEVVDSLGTLRSVESPVQAFAANTWVHIAIAWNFNALPAANSDDLRIYIDGGAAITSAFSSNGNLDAGLDFVYAGDNPSGVVGTKGTVNSANGTIDELQFYNTELIQAQVLAGRSATHACPIFAIDHLELQHATWTGISCAPSTMTVVACANASCSSLYTQGLIATLSSSGVSTVWDATTGGATVVIGNTQSSTTKNFYAASGTGALSVNGTGVPALETNPKKCNGAGASCNWTSSNGGLILTVPGSGVIIGGKPVAVTVQAVQSSGPTPGSACIPIKNLTASGLKMWSTPVTPASFAPTSISASVTVGGVPQVATANAGPYVDATTSLPGSNNLSPLDFDSTASTTIWLKHRDTGQFSLNATLDNVATGTTPALSLPGTTTVKAIPVGYGISAATVLAPNATQTACAGGQSAICDTTAGADTRVASAGTNFSSKIIAALWTVDGDTDLSDNPVAPSYAGAVALNSLLAAPMGGSGGTLGSSSATLVSGTVTNASQNWSQSGAMRIAASGTYLGQSVLGQSSVLGRFSPKNFNTVVTQGCSTFTYSRQPIPVVTVNAMDAAAIPAVTPNYVGAFARSVTLSDGGASAAGAFTTNTILASSFVAGSATGSPVYTFISPQTKPTTVILRASDGEVSSSGFTEGISEIRSGRVNLINAYGSELLALPIPIKIEYWNTNVGWSSNTVDTCTAITNSNFSFDFPAGTAAKPNNLSACETALTISGSAPNFALSLSKPGAGNNGWANLTLNLGNAVVAANSQCSAVGGPGATDIPGNRAWLQFNWKGTGLVNPAARGFFGIFGVKSPVIYQRENY